MLNEEQFKQLSEKLDTIIKLVAGNLLKDAGNKTRKVEVLHSLGISTKEIAQLVDTTEQSVETLKTRLKKRTEEVTSKGGKKSGKD